MDETTVAPVADQAPEAEHVEDVAEQQAAPESDQPAEEGAEKSAKPQKTAEQKLIERQNRKIAALHAQRAAERERAAAAEERLRILGGSERLQTAREGDTTDPDAAGDADRVSLPRSELQRVIEREARRLVPQIQAQSTVEETRRAAARGLVEEIGADRFHELSSEVAAVLPNEETLLGILDTPSPRHLLEYLAEPENATEAERIARLPPLRQGIELATLALRLKSRAARAKEVSEAPKPLEVPKGQGSSGPKSLAQLSDEEYAKRRREQIAARGRW